MTKHIHLAAHVTIKPSRMLKRMREHSGDISESDKGTVMARRTILGRKVTFYENGVHTVEGGSMTEEDEFGSGLLKLAHASISTNKPAGDKSQLWVDATTDNVKIYMRNMTFAEYKRKAKELLRSGKLSLEQFINTTPKEIQEIYLTS